MSINPIQEIRTLTKIFESESRVAITKRGNFKATKDKEQALKLDQLNQRIENFIQEHLDELKNPEGIQALKELDQAIKGRMSYVKGKKAGLGLIDRVFLRKGVRLDEARKQLTLLEGKIASYAAPFFETQVVEVKKPETAFEEAIESPALASPELEPQATEAPQAPLEAEHKATTAPKALKEPARQEEAPPPAQAMEGPAPSGGPLASGPPPPAAPPLNLGPPPKLWSKEPDMPTFDRLQFKNLDKDRGKNAQLVEKQISVISQYVAEFGKVYEPIWSAVKKVEELEQREKDLVDDVKSLKEEKLRNELIQKELKSATDQKRIAYLYVTKKGKRITVPFFTEDGLKKENEKESALSKAARTLFNLPPQFGPGHLIDSIKPSIDKRVKESTLELAKAEKELLETRKQIKDIEEKKLGGKGSLIALKKLGEEAQKRMKEWELGILRRQQYLNKAPDVAITEKVNKAQAEEEIAVYQKSSAISDVLADVKELYGPGGQNVTAINFFNKGANAAEFAATLLPPENPKAE